jgi:hypothetical protein
VLTQAQQEERTTVATIGVTHHLMFIDGKDVDGEEFYEIRSPATDELVR